MLFKGSAVAIVTPMLMDGTIDKSAFENLIEWHIDAKTDARVVAGTTGEGSTLTMEEQYDLIKTAGKIAGTSIPVIAGTGSNSTRHTIELTEQAKNAGADAALIVTPYYNKPTQQGLYEHYKMVVENVGIPIILYNVPGRTACDLLPETIEQIAKFPRVIGIKEATGKPERTKEIIDRCGKNFAVYSGDDATTLSCMRAGGIGVISVTANLAPHKMHHFCQAMLNGDIALAEKINQELELLHKNLFLESNPIPTKWALAQMRKMENGIRLPLTPLSEKFHPDVLKAMKAAGIA